MKHRYTLFRRKGTKVWYFYHYQEGQRRARSTGESVKHQAEREAERYLTERENEGRRIRLAAFTAGFFDMAGEWVRTQHDADYSFSKKQSKIRNGHLKNWIVPQFGDRWLDSIEPYEIRRWLQDLELANGTKNAIISTLNIIFSEARFRKYLSANPMQDVRRFSPRYRGRDAFTLDDIRFLFPRGQSELLRIWGHPKWLALYYTMLTTGIRRGEAAALQWRHIIWPKRGLVVLQAVKAEGVLGPPKSGDQRAVLLPARSMAILRWWHDQTLWPEEEDFIFYGQVGKRISPSTITENFSRALARAGFNAGGRNLTVHSLRHTYNTRLEKVLPGEILRYMVGHSTAAMTERYLHVTPEERLEEYLPARKQIGRAWG